MTLLAKHTKLNYNNISCHKLSQNDHFVRISEFGRRHLERPFLGPRDSEFLADPDFGWGPAITVTSNHLSRPHRESQ